MDTKRIAIMILLVSIAACTTSGHLRGMLTAQNQPAQPVLFSFKSDTSGEGGQLSAQLPTGEYFTGKYVHITSQTLEGSVTPMFRGWDPYWSAWGPFGDPWYGGSGYSTFRTNYSGKVVASLFGDKGDTMRCRFNLSKPQSGLSGGGAGECEVSNGATIAVQF